MSIPSVPTKLWLALKSRMQTIRIDGQAIDFAWPAQPYQPRTSSRGDPIPYLSVGRASATPERLQIGSREQRIYSGSLILTLVHPLIVDVEGKSAPEEAYVERAAQVASYFPEDSRIAFGDVCLRVLTTPAVQDGYQDVGYWRIPIIVDWRSIA